MSIPVPQNPKFESNLGQSPMESVIVPFERQLNQNLEWAMSEGSVFFEGRGKVQESLRRITRRLDELGVPYAVAGGMALYLHGYHRFTEDVDILVTRDGLQLIHEKLDGLGYVRRFATSKNLRDADSGVKIESLLTGSFPGDCKPKDIAFPDPSSVAEIRNGIKVLNIPTLISLKIASAMTGAGRTKDLGDVEELIKLLGLSESLSTTLHPSVRDKYLEIWRSINATRKRYVLLWRHQPITAHAKSLDEMIELLKGAAGELEQMRADGIVLESDGHNLDDYAYLVTYDRTIAEKYQMEDESEFFETDEKKEPNDSDSSQRS